MRGWEAALLESVPAAAILSVKIARMVAWLVPPTGSAVSKVVATSEKA